MKNLNEILRVCKNTKFWARLIVFDFFVCVSMSGGVTYVAMNKGLSSGLFWWNLFFLSIDIISFFFAFAQYRQRCFDMYFVSGRMGHDLDTFEKYLQQCLDACEKEADQELRKDWGTHEHQQ